MPELADTYLFWTNKGGVGKTTLCFHSAMAYAQLHPDTKVIVIDTDEQANLSQVFLTKKGDPESGGKNCSELRNISVHQKGYPRTLCGALLAAKANDLDRCRVTAKDKTQLSKESSFLVNPHDEGFNKSIPPNVYLLCGDPRIITLLPKFQAYLSAPGAREFDPATGVSEWGEIMSYLKYFLQEASEQLSSGTATTAFIDSNPSMTIWTEMALVAADKLVVPVNADDFSVAALENMFFSVYGLYSFGGTMAQYEKGMFHSILKQQGLSVPKIHAVVHNRSTIFRDDRGNGFRAMNSAQAQTLYSAYKKAEEKGELDRIFNKEQLERSELTKINNADEFAEVFTGTMRDMLTSAIATQHLGIPLWFVHRSRKQIKKDLSIKSVKHSASSSLKDLIGADPAAIATVVTKAENRNLMQLLLHAVPGDKCTDIWKKFEVGKGEWKDVEDQPAGSPSTAHASKKRKGE